MNQFNFLLQSWFDLFIPKSTIFDTFNEPPFISVFNRPYSDYHINVEYHNRDIYIYYIITTPFISTL